MIALSHVTLSYGARPAVEDVSFAIKPGENLCMVGPNGSGKSTLIKGMLGLMKPEGGEIRRDPGLKVAYLAQAHTFERDFPATVWEIVLSGTLGRSLNPLYTRAQKASASLAREPELIVMDEPCSALDPVITQELYALFDELKREKGLTMFIATHDWEYVRAHADRVLVLNRTLRFLGPASAWHAHMEEGAMCQ